MLSIISFANFLPDLTFCKNFASQDNLHVRNFVKLINFFLRLFTQNKDKRFIFLTYGVFASTFFLVTIITSYRLPSKQDSNLV